MESHDILRQSIERVGAKRIASELGMSMSSVYKWTQDKGERGSGSPNPLDRTLEICRQTNDVGILQWLCQKMGGYFVPNHPVPVEKAELEFLKSTQGMLGEFSDLLKALSNSYEEDHVIDAVEAQVIRSQWENLKAHAETFVSHCENGDYNQSPKRKVSSISNMRNGVCR